MTKFEYDCSGYATKSGILCTDGITIGNGAFVEQSGEVVPVVWNHKHDSISDVLGQAMLEDRNGDVYTYVKFNEDTEHGRLAKTHVEHGDITSFSICANKLVKNGKTVMHGCIREVSLVIAPANPSARIDSIIRHSADGSEEEELIYVLGEAPEIKHASDEEETIDHAAEETVDQNTEEDDIKHNQKLVTSDPTVMDIIETMNEDQQTVLFSLLHDAIENALVYRSENSEEETAEQEMTEEPEKKEERAPENANSKEEEKIEHAEEAVENKEETDPMKTNVFDNPNTGEEQTLRHSIDEGEVLKMARSSSCGSFKEALRTYINDNDTLKHGFDQTGDHSIDKLFPDHKLINPGAPELLTDDYGWVAQVINKCSKSPISRVRVRQVDARNSKLQEQIRAYGYNEKGTLKKNIANMKLISRTVDPQTIYVKDYMNRDDRIDITDFDVVAYIENVMRMMLNAEIARAVLFGDGRDDGDTDKIQPTHIVPVWGDDPLYTIYRTVDVEAMKAQLEDTTVTIEGEDGSVINKFDESYVIAEAMIQESLYGREHYHGSGNMDMFIAPHMLNKMLLARDRMGHRMYANVAELTTAFNVRQIIPVEEMEGLYRTFTVSGVEHYAPLYALMVNLNDYQIGATRGGEITRFSDFDIDYNQEKYLIETRLSGALTRVQSAVVLEGDTTVEPNT